MEKIQHMIATVDQTVAFAQNPKQIKRSDWGLTWRGSNAALGGLTVLQLMILVFIFSGYLFENVGLLVCALGISLYTVLKLRQIMYKNIKKLKDIHLLKSFNDLEMNGKKFNESFKNLFAPALSTQKIAALNTAKQVNMDQDMLQQLVVLTERSDIPQGWWSVLQKELDATLDAQQNPIVVYTEDQAHQDLQEFTIADQAEIIDAPTKQYMKV